MREKKEVTQPPINGGYKLHTFEDVKEIYCQYITKNEDRQAIEDAYNFVIKKHEGQSRKSGEPYHHHLIEVAYILSTLQCGPTTIAAGLLHDVVEDTEVGIDVIEKRWGADVAKIVDSVTKIQRLKLSKIQKEEFAAEDHRKIFLGMAKDIRVILIKLADRLHNLRTLGALTRERQIAIAKESLTVFIPIAHRLGLDKLKSEMQDLCLLYLEPEKYKEISKLLSGKAKTMKKYLDSLKKRIADILFEKKIPFDISARVKSIYSIYEKMYVKGHAFGEIYDILALRIITETDIQCYEILGLIHQIYKPVPGRFKDYIAMPKPNMYQSLHTTIVSGDGNIYEIQIRTKKMDEVAEVGVAAHWAYKERAGYNPREEQKEIENQLHWFRDFVSLSKESLSESAVEYVDSLTKDIFEANVYVFTPKGKVIELPQGSTPIDFAYRIHTKVGDSTVGAIVNGVMVPLNTVLNTGDMVEIKTSKTSTGPKESWLDFARSAQAKGAIKKSLAKRDAGLLREDKITKGKQSLIDAFKDRGYTKTEMDELISNNRKLLERFNVDTIEDLYLAVSGRSPSPGAVLEFLNVKRKISIPTGGTVKQIKKDDFPVYCQGVGKIAINLANCCTPIPGDPIIGYITRGKGITVHRAECPNIASSKDRLIEVFWREDLEPDKTYPCDLLLSAKDRNNLLMDIVNCLSTLKINLANFHARKAGNAGNVLVSVTVMVNNVEKLSNVMNVLINVPSVYEVKRVIH